MFNYPHLYRIQRLSEPAARHLSNVTRSVSRVAADSGVKTARLGRATRRVLGSSALSSSQLLRMAAIVSTITINGHVDAKLNGKIKSRNQLRRLKQKQKKAARTEDEVSHS